MTLRAYLAVPVQALSGLQLLLVVCRLNAMIRGELK